MKHIPSLDGVRGVAILTVMAHHLMVIQDAPNVYRFTEFGMYGVDLFFVLSGFLITGILLDSRNDAHAFRNFYARRSLRIFPLYYAVVAFCLLIIPLLADHLPRVGTKLEKLASVGTEGGLWYLTYTANFLVAKNDAWRHAVLDITWSLSIEEQFYLLWAPVVILIPVRYFPRICISLIAGAFICRILLAAFGFSPLQIFVLTPCRMDSLAAGALLAGYVRRDLFNPSKLTKTAYIAAMPVASVLFLLLSMGDYAFDTPKG